MDVYEEALALHKAYRGKLEIKNKVPLQNRDDLSLAYTPGVAEPCRQIAKNRNDVYTYTIKGNTVAVVSDGSSVLGLGNIGAEAAIPVMEGKAALFKEFAGIDAFPICIASQKTEDIILVVQNIAPVFGGINLEDISAPRCFAVEEQLQDIGIPVMHDDQHGTAVVVLAGLLNACKVTERKLDACKVVISGAGAAGTAITKFLLSQNVSDIIVCDSKGIISAERTDLNEEKELLANMTNKHGLQGTLADAVKERDVFIGVSVAGTLHEDMVKSMANDCIIFAMANPVPEIMPDLAKKAGAAIVATGRSDFPNQVNNVLAFPGIFRGALDARASRITHEMKLAAAHALASCIRQPTAEEILPNILDKNVTKAVAEAVRKAAKA
ncbi:MAG: NADP-dependent malic enzyme [archaeon]